jgi:hypothetical protein
LAIPFTPLVALKQKKLWYRPAERPRIIGLPQQPHIGRIKTLG